MPKPKLDREGSQAPLVVAQRWLARVALRAVITKRRQIADRSRGDGSEAGRCRDCEVEHGE